VISSSHGIVTTSPSVFQGILSPSLSGKLTHVDFIEAFSSPEITPFKTFTTTKAPLKCDITKPTVYIPGMRSMDDDRYENCNELEDYEEGEDVENTHCGYQDIIFEVESERSVSVFFTLALHPTACASISFMPDFPMSTSTPVLSFSQKGDSEYEDTSEQEYDGEDEDADEDEDTDEDMDLESDSSRFVSISCSRSNTYLPQSLLYV
jgi:hypothetical protein